MSDQKEIVVKRPLTTEWKDWNEDMKKNKRDGISQWKIVKCGSVHDAAPLLLRKCAWSLDETTDRDRDYDFWIKHHHQRQVRWIIELMYVQYYWLCSSFQSEFSLLSFSDFTAFGPLCFHEFMFSFAVVSWGV